MKKCKMFFSLMLTITLLIGMSCISETVLAKDTTSADFVFIIDSTGSMDPYINNVKKNLTSFVTELSNRGINLRMAVLDYKDVTVNDNNSNETTIHQFDGSNWTSDVNQVIEAFNSIRVNGGEDDKETPTEAINQALDNLKTEDEWYNDGHKTFMFLLTDADYKESVDSPSNPDLVPDMSAVVYCNRMLGINTTVVSKTDLEERYKQLYSLTGGIFIDINSDNYDELMNKVATWIEDTMVDSDGDGLLDEWETNGVTIDGTFIDFPRMGANPRKPDIFIEADWMEYAGDSFDFLWIHKIRNKKSTAPSSKALSKVYYQFKSHGINIHIDAGPDSIMNYDTGETWGALSGASALAYQETFYLGSNFENWNQLAIDNFTKSRWTTFRYCVFVNQYDNGDGNRSSGIAENIPGQFFIVASDCIDGSKSNHDTALAGTFMHELGHTLGLSHGGLYFDQTAGEIKNNHDNYKPNHLSIMNYTYQFSGLKTVLGDYVSNYQEFRLPEIDESHIDESRGIDPDGVTDGKGLTIKIPVKNKFLFWKYDGTTDADIARQPIDFNKNGIIENDIAYNINNDQDNNGNQKIGLLTETLNEWDNLKYYGGLISGNGEEFDLSKVTQLITKSELDHELDELSIDDAFDLGLLGDIGDCEFNNVDSNVLCSELNNQRINFSIINKYPEKTNVSIKVNSELLLSDYTNEIEVGVDGADIDIPVKNNINVGEYDVNYSMILSNGKTVNSTSKIKVVAPEIIKMNIGDETSIPYEYIDSCISSNENIVKIVDNKVIAESKGIAYVTVVSEGNYYYAKVEVNKSNNENPNNNTGTGSTTTTTTTASGANIESPKTGDSNAVSFFVVVLMGSFTLGIVCLKLYKRKKQSW